MESKEKRFLVAFAEQCRKARARAGRYARPWATQKQEWNHLSHDTFRFLTTAEEKIKDGTYVSERERGTNYIRLMSDGVIKDCISRALKICQLLKEDLKIPFTLKIAKEIADRVIVRRHNHKAGPVRPLKNRLNDLREVKIRKYFHKLMESTKAHNFNIGWHELYPDVTKINLGFERRKNYGGRAWTYAHRQITLTLNEKAYKEKVLPLLNDHKSHGIPAKTILKEQKGKTWHRPETYVLPLWDGLIARKTGNCNLLVHDPVKAAIQKKIDAKETKRKNLEYKEQERLRYEKKMAEHIEQRKIEQENLKNLGDVAYKFVLYNSVTKEYYSHHAPSFRYKMGMPAGDGREPDGNCSGGGVFVFANLKDLEEARKTWSIGTRERNEVLVILRGKCEGIFRRIISDTDFLFQKYAVEIFIPEKEIGYFDGTVPIFHYEVPTLDEYMNTMGPAV